MAALAPLSPGDLSARLGQPFVPKEAAELTAAG